MLPMISVIIPLYNEEDNIIPLAESLEAALASVAYEVIFVDDGSRDATVKRVNALAMPQVSLLQFARNYGQTSAIAAGIEAAKGEYIVTMDGDLQNDPDDILMMLETLKEQQCDVVVGRRVKRQDGMFLRKVPSYLANKLIQWLTRIPIHDYGCTLKLFRASIAKELDLYGELHRFIPILSTMEGASLVEVEVKHHPRRHGVSKYGLGRTIKVLSDLLLMLFFLKYRQKPMHLFGSLGCVTFMSGMMIAFYLLYEKILGNDIADRPVFYVGILLFFMAVQFFTTGFIAELMMRTYYDVRNRKPYRIMAHYRKGKKQ